MQKVKMFRMVLVLLMLFSCLSLNVEAAAGFSDVSDSAYYADAVKWAVDRSITNGMGDGTFGVNNTVTRAQAVTFLWRYKGQPSPTVEKNPFTDVKSDDYSKDAILWAVENSITEGMGDNKFEPDGSVTRGQMITFLWRSNGKPNDTGGAWYEAAENWANSIGILNGTAQKYATNDACPRCDVVYYLYLDMNNGNSGNSESGGNTSSGNSSGWVTTGTYEDGTVWRSKYTEEEIREREKKIYAEYGGTYEGYIDYLYKAAGGEVSKEQLRQKYPNTALGTSYDPTGGEYFN